MTNQERVRNRFFEVLNSGGDVTIFANVPLDFLDSEMKEILDSKIYQASYDALRVQEEKEFDQIVLLSMFGGIAGLEPIEMKIGDRTSFLTFLDNMLNYFVKTEEYEKCSYLQQRKLYYTNGQTTI